MAESHEEQEGPIHQAPWVFYLTVVICYAVLMLIMFAKFLSSDSMGFGEVMNVFGIQAGLFAGFAAMFGAMLYVMNKMLGATSGDDH